MNAAIALNETNSNECFAIDKTMSDESSRMHLIARAFVKEDIESFIYNILISESPDEFVCEASYLKDIAIAIYEKSNNPNRKKASFIRNHTDIQGLFRPISKNVQNKRKTRIA